VVFFILYYFFCRSRTKEIMALMQDELDDGLGGWWNGFVEREGGWVGA